ncbi:MAG TPA: dihydropteroate synthase [Terriglobia bacterium]
MPGRPIFTIRIAGRPVALGRRTLVMGVLNVTPDSFSDGGLYLDPKSAVEHGLEMARQGADWIDVGGESTRPGSKPVTVDGELARVLPVIRGLHRRAPKLPISIDTTKAAVAEAALKAGAAVINDVSGLRVDPALADVARHGRTPLVLMHLRGRPETMQQGPFAREIRRSLGRGLAWSIRQALERGVCRSQLLIDPGLGFGKTRRQNYQILAGLTRLQRFGLPLVVGSSRKSFVRAIASGEGLDPDSTRRRTHGRRHGARPEAASLQMADAAAVVAAILEGAHVVRIHDVAALMPAIRIADATLEAR